MEIDQNYSDGELKELDEKKHRYTPLNNEEDGDDEEEEEEEDDDIDVQEIGVMEQKISPKKQRKDDSENFEIPKKEDGSTLDSPLESPDQMELNDSNFKTPNKKRLRSDDEEEVERPSKKPHKIDKWKQG